MKKKDLIFILSAVAAAVICALAVRGIPGERVYIYKDNTLFGTYSLYDDRTVDIAGANRLQIKNGSVYIDYADCPDKLCVKQGKICTGGRSIVCLPNRVTVTIGGKSDIDAVSR